MGSATYGTFHSCECVYFLFLVFESQNFTCDKKNLQKFHVDTLGLCAAVSDFVTAHAQTAIKRDQENYTFNFCLFFISVSLDDEEDKDLSSLSSHDTVGMYTHLKKSRLIHMKSTVTHT